ncbi:MAG: CBS domain-containing protein [Euryarchaeota archaeon]|nr:CBS domain-containing protein [Euryarchaeota archaeon]
MVKLVKDFMIEKKEIVTPEDSVSSAIELMIENDIGSVVVEDIKKNKVVGIFTERDILRRFMSNRDRFVNMTIAEVMTSPVVTVSEDTALADAIRLMKKHDVSRLPVVDDKGSVVGILFWKNIFDICCCNKVE